MNKIYQAFNTIKLDEITKKRVYQKLEKRQKKQVYIKLIYGASFVLTSLILFIAISINNLPQRNKDDDVNILSTPRNSLNDEIFYNGNRYLLSNDIDINTVDIDKKIGKLKKIDSNSELKNDFESYYYDGYEVYSSSNKNVLIVNFNNNTLVYIKE
jgi:hypothetical protein